MTRTQWRWLIVIFWVVVIGMLLKQCWQAQTAPTVESPEQIQKEQHFFFTSPPKPHIIPSAPQPTLGPDVHQTKFEVQANTPGQGMFTCNVTLMNEGETIAHNVQIFVRPYRGVYQGNDSLGGHTKYGKLAENDPTSQLGVWLTYPDLKPGETVTQSTTFLNHSNVLPGFNPDPQIIFEAPKP